MNNNNKSVTFVYGSDDFLVDRRARDVFDKFCGGEGEIFLLDNEKSFVADINHSISAIETIPLFETGNFIWLRGAIFFSEPTLSDDKCLAAERLIHAIKSHHGKTIVISAGKVDKRTKLFKGFQQLSDTIEVGAGEISYTTEQMIQSFASENHVKITPEAIHVLQMKCGNNFRVLEQEINKLTTYVGKNADTITKQDVIDIVDDYPDGNFFEPVEKFFENDLPATLKALDKYFFNNDDARALLSGLQSRNRLLIQLRCLIDTKRIKSFNTLIKADFFYAAKACYMDGLEKSSFNVFSQNLWYLSKLLPTCGRFQLSRLLKFHQLFNDTLQDIIDNPYEQKMVMKKLSSKCLGCTN